MRILNEPEKVITCSKCESVIAYFDHEVKRTINPPCFEEVYDYHIHCPKCGKSITVKV